MSKIEETLEILEEIMGEWFGVSITYQPSIMFQRLAELRDELQS